MGSRGGGELFHALISLLAGREGGALYRSLVSSIVSSRGDGSLLCPDFVYCIKQRVAAPYRPLISPDQAGGAAFYRPLTALVSRGEGGMVLHRPLISLVSSSGGGVLTSPDFSLI